MTLKKLYIRGVILPSIIAIVSTGVLSVIDADRYKTPWVTKESLIFISILISFIHSLIICTLSLTFFLNNKIIKTEPATFLSWFLFPMTWILFAVSWSIYHRQKHVSDDNRDLIYLAVLTVPFIIGLIWTYIVFKKDNGRTL
jgi:hypothetical protein